MPSHFFFFHVLEDGTPEVFPVSNTRHLSLDGTDYILVPIRSTPDKPTTTKRGRTGRPPRPPKPTQLTLKGTERKESWPRDRVADILMDAGSEGIHPLQIREKLSDVWPVALGPILAALMREKIAKRLSDGRWAIT